MFKIKRVIVKIEISFIKERRYIALGQNRIKLNSSFKAIAEGYLHYFKNSSGILTTFVIFAFHKHVCQLFRRKSKHLL